MAFDATQLPLLGPSSIAVHDNGNVAGHLVRVERKIQAAIPIRILNTGYPNLACLVGQAMAVLAIDKLTVKEDLHQWPAKKLAF